MKDSRAQSDDIIRHPRWLLNQQEKEDNNMTEGRVLEIPGKFLGIEAKNKQMEIVLDFFSSFSVSQDEN
jgi:hypothetical protein